MTELDNYFKKEEAIWHRILSLVSKDPAYVWKEVEDKDFEKLREATIELFREFHWKKPNLYKYEKEELQKLFIELVGKFWEENKGLLRKGVKKQDKLVEEYGPENWFEKVKNDIIEINHLIIKSRSNRAYEADAKNYDDTFDCVFLTTFAHFYDNTLKKLKKLYLNKDVLDYGCGTGEHALEIAKNAKYVYGFDLSLDLIKKANEKLKFSNMRNARFILADGVEIPFKENSFDFILSLDLVISHIGAKYHIAFKEISRVLRKGGWLLFDCDNKWRFLLKEEEEKYQRALEAPKDIGNLHEWGLSEDEWDEKYKGKVKPIIFKTFTHQELKEILEENGFEIIKQWGIGCLTTSLIPKVASKFFGEEIYDEKIGLNKSVFGRFQLWFFSRLDYTLGRMPYLSKKCYNNLILARKIK